MPDTFQPEKPQSPSRTPEGGMATPIVVAIVSGLMVIMLFAIAVPRIFWDGEINWLISIGAGVLVFILILVYGLSKRAGG